MTAHKFIKYERVFPMERYLQLRYADGFMVIDYSYSTISRKWYYNVIARNQESLLLAEHMLLPYPTYD